MLAAKLEASRARISELEARIDIDPLTEIRNRRGFFRELERSLAYVKRYGTSAALIYIDLDGFKPVNDRHGHAAGDAVLKAIAAALVQHTRTSDIVARIGGDEFAVLLWNVNGAAAAAKAAALEAAVYATPVRWNSSTLVVGASAGVALLGALDKSRRSSGAGRRRDVCAQGGAERPLRAASRNDIRRELIFNEGDTIAQLQLLFFQALHLKQIRAGRILQRSNRGVEVAMRLVQPRQLGPQLVFFLLSHALWVTPGSSPRRSARW